MSPKGLETLQRLLEPPSKSNGAKRGPGSSGVKAFETGHIPRGWPHLQPQSTSLKAAWPFLGQRLWVRGWEEGWNSQRLQGWGCSKEASSRCLLSFLSGQLPYLENEAQIGTPWDKARHEWRPVQRVEPHSRKQSAKLGDRKVCRGPRIGLQRPENSPVGEDSVISFVLGDTKS